MYLRQLGTSLKSLPSEQAIAAFWRVVEGNNDARQQHKDISTVLKVLEEMPLEEMPGDPTLPPS
jgi:alkylated DNA nucleotide flippase Atl1